MSDFNRIRSCGCSIYPERETSSTTCERILTCERRSSCGCTCGTDNDTGCGSSNNNGCGSSNNGCGSSNNGCGSNNNGCGSNNSGCGSSNNGCGSNNNGCGSSNNGCGSNNNGCGSNNNGCGSNNNGCGSNNNGCGSNNNGCGSNNSGCGSNNNGCGSNNNGCGSNNNGCGSNNNGCGSNNSGDNSCLCCKTSMRAALRLFCSNEVSDLVDFDSFAFLTDSNVVGADLNKMSCECRDNLGVLNGTFRRFSPCNCDLIDIQGCVSGAGVEVNQASLCSLSAIAFQLAPARPTDDQSCCCCNTLETDESRYRRLRDLLQCELENTDRPCGQCICHCNCTDDCCCTTGVLNALSDTSLNKRTTLVAGLLIVRDVTALGTIGNVLVLGNEAKGRFYFVCSGKVEFLA